MQTTTAGKTETSESNIERVTCTLSQTQWALGDIYVDDLLTKSTSKERELIVKQLKAIRKNINHLLLGADYHGCQ